jgi:hypothetical protein
MTEEELKTKKLELEIKALKRPPIFKLTTWTSLFAIFIALGGVLGQNILSNIKSENAKFEMNAILARRDSTAKEVSRMTDSLSQARENYKALVRQEETTADSANKNLTELGSLIRQHSANNDQKIQSLIKQTQNVIGARVYIQIGEEAERAKAEKLKSLLAANNFIVVGIENIAGKASIPSKSDVRYYRDEEKDEANGVIRIMREANLGLAINDKPIKLSVNTNNTRPRHYEIWLSRY